MRIEIAYATPERQVLLACDVEPGTTVDEAVSRACNNGDLPEVAATLPVGVWGRVVDRQKPLREGDRVELYRPLAMDPREARRRYAEAGGTMADRKPG